MADRRNKQNLRKLTLTSILTALIIVMSFTPIGYLKIGVVSITFISIPVVIGAIVEGPAIGAFLGGIFGLTSFAQCFGMEAFGTALFSVNPLYTGILCIVPRVLMGLLSGLIFKAVKSKFKRNAIPCGIASVSGGIMNTVLFVTALILFFGNSEVLSGLGDTVPAIIASLVTFNAIIEWIACFAIGTAVSKTLFTVIKNRM